MISQSTAQAATRRHASVYVARFNVMMTPLQNVQHHNGA